MQKVFVLDCENQPLAPCHPARARQMLAAGRATVYRRFPFTVILKERVGGEVQPVTLKIDPGSKTTGVALVQENRGGRVVVWAGEIAHRGQLIRDNLLQRRSLRRGRRQRKTRYRPARFMNRRRPEGWLPPSLRSRLANITTWFTRLYKFAPINSLSMELVKFDTQIMQHPEVEGVGYQQGELAGYEVREYLLEKWNRTCAYCGAKDTPLEIEHLTPKSRGGSDRVSNLTLACHPCNQKKGNQTATEFGHPQLQARARMPLKDAAAINSARWALFEQLKLTGLPVECGTGGRTKYNRIRQDYPKAHWVDAACVGESGAAVGISGVNPLLIQAKGRGHRQMQRVNAFGFPCATPREHVKRRHGYQTGDIVRCTIPKGKYAGRYVARISECNRRNFALKRLDDPKANKLSVSGAPDFRIIQRADGYSYQV